MQDIVIIQRDALRTELADILKSELSTILSGFQPTPQKQESFLTRKETAQLFGVSLPTLDEWVKSGIVKAYRIGAHIRFKLTEVESSLKEIKSIKNIA